MRKIVLSLLLIFLISFDLVSKWFFENIVFGESCTKVDGNIPLGSYCYSGEYIPLLGQYLGFELSRNFGVAFSLPIRGFALQIITIFLILFIVCHYYKEEWKKQSNIIDLGYVLILAGAIAHGYERIFIGHVVDFISVKYFAILNFADIFISVGFALIIYSYVFIERRKSR